MERESKHVASALQAAGGVAVGSGSGPSLTHDSVKTGRVSRQCKEGKNKGNCSQIYFFK